MDSERGLFSNIGIDSVGFYAPRNYVDIVELAEKRHVDPNKYKKGLLLKEMRIPDRGEDIISIGLKAGFNAINRGDINPKDIDAVFVGTETMTYAVKSVSNIFAELLGVSKNSMCQDVYNACAAGTLALLNAIALIEKDIISSALVIGADISSYNIGSPSEPTQGAGAIALVISRNPRIAAFSNHFGKVSGNVNDFFRPANEENAQVFGHYSVETYLNFQLEAYDDLIRKMGNFNADFYAFHAPFAKLPLKAMQRIIQKRWINDISNILMFEKNNLKSSIVRKIDSLIKNVFIIPEYIYLKMKEKGFSSEFLEKLSHGIISTIKNRVEPQLTVPMHFGNMYSASVWAQVIYILENYARGGDTVYFGSYGSGATCLSGLMKVRHGFKRVVEKGPRIDYFIKNKEHKSIKEYEHLKDKKLDPIIHLGRIVEHENNNEKGFILHFCDEGCIISEADGLNYCPKGHSGFHEKFFPLHAILETSPKMVYAKDLSFFKDNLVRISPNARKGNTMEYEMRRVEYKTFNFDNIIGMINWAPIYIPVQNLY